MAKAVNEEETLTKTENDDGPGLLQKEDAYYKDHQAALDSIWKAFESKLPAAVGVDVVPVSVLSGSPEYLALTKHVPKKLLGKDIAPGANQLVAAGLNWVSPANNAKLLDSVAKLSGAGQLLLVENRGSYKMHGGVAIGGLGAGVAKMRIDAHLHLYRPGKGVVWSGSYRGESSETGAIVAGTMSTSAYPKLLPQAFEGAFGKFAEEAKKGAMPVPASAAP